MASTAAEAPPAPAEDSPVLRAAWERYQATFTDLHRLVTGSRRFREEPQHRAKGYHVLIEAQAFAYNFAIAPRLAHPRLFINTIWQTDVYTIGTNGPDFFYTLAFLDGTQTYRLTGNVGDTRMILVQASNGLPGSPGATLLANYDFQDFEVADDGSFEIIVGAQPHDGNWIRLDPEPSYHWLQFRRATGDWEESPGTLALERISDIADDHYEADEFDEAAVARRIDAAADFARHIVTEWGLKFHDRYLEAGGGHNVFSRFPGAEIDPQASLTADYVLAAYEVGEDEALILTLDRVPGGIYWSYQLADVWSRSLNFTERQTTLNFAHAKVDGDGAVRAVVAHRDPGVANWLDTTGRKEGQIAFRNYRSPQPIVPGVQRVKLAELDRHLPADTARVTPEERKAELKRRRAGFLAKHGE